MPGEQYFAASPSVPARPTEVEFAAGGHRFRLTAARGVFSAERLDPGTAVLLHKAPLPGPDLDGALLDLGCGYGAIACVLSACAPRATVYAVDVNTRALALTRANAGTVGAAERVVAVLPDQMPEAVRFRQIWSNPPIRVGKGELHAMLDRWLPRLEPDGAAWLVVARNLGADSLQAWLGGQGWQVVRHASQQGFRVLRVSRHALRNSGDGSPSGPENG